MDPNDPGGSDRTILRPSPGGRRPTAGPAGGSDPFRSSMPPPQPDPRREAAEERLELVAVTAGLGPLVDAASPLLLLAVRLRGTLQHPSPENLYREAVHLVRRFDEDARRAGLPPEIAVPARYALCTFVDESVLGTPWGSQSAWANQSLLVTFHKEAWGGEKFFQIVERAQQSGDRDRELLRLLYVCIALGFEGRYRAEDRGRERLQAVQDQLARMLRDRDRGSGEIELSPHWQGVQDRRHKLVRYVPFWIIASVAGLLVLGAFAWLHLSLGSAAAPIQGRLARIGVESAVAAVPPAPVVRTGPSLKQLLAPEEQAGELEVVEDAAGTTIILAGDKWFPSASASIDSSRLPVLERVTSVLAEARGPIEVVGHSDDVPLRSFRFKDNYDLSRQRAVSVQTLLLTGDSPYCCQTRGAGPDEPRHQPPSDPANRALNRRVEIRVLGG